VSEAVLVGDTSEQLSKPVTATDVFITGGLSIY